MHVYTWSRRMAYAHGVHVDAVLQYPPALWAKMWLYVFEVLVRWAYAALRICIEALVRWTSTSLVLAYVHMWSIRIWMWQVTCGTLFGSTLRPSAPNMASHQSRGPYLRWLSTGRLRRPICVYAVALYASWMRWLCYGARQ